MKKVLIVGGGIAGLAAGVYARQSGYAATIFEMHTIPGGNSTSWKRKGYLFEGGMHWLVGSKEGSALNRLWREVGALGENNPIKKRDPFLTYMGKERIALARDTQTLVLDWTDYAPEDEAAIRRLAKDIRLFYNISMPVMDIKGVRVKQKSTPPLSMLFSVIRAARRMKALNAMSVGDYIAGFHNKGLVTLLENVVGSNEFTAMSLVVTLASLAAGDGGYPKGGSLLMAQNMADAFVALGGEIQYEKRVERVEVQNGCARGVYVDGQFYGADYVVVTADTLTAADRLFSPPLNEPWIEELKRVVTPLCCTFISIGVNADLKDLPEGMIFPLTTPFEYANRSFDFLPVNNYANYKGYAPNGKTALTCVLMGDTYEQWLRAKEEGTYAAKKEELASRVTELLGELIPRTKGAVEVVDVATPLTYERYCGTYHGSWMSVMSPGGGRQQYPLKAESVQNLYFAGQRVMLPGGLPSALSTGRQAVQHICRDEATVFQGDY